jgi:hypothetical protein
MGEGAPGVGMTGKGMEWRNGSTTKKMEEEISVGTTMVVVLMTMMIPYEAIQMTLVWTMHMDMILMMTPMMDSVILKLVTISLSSNFHYYYSFYYRCYCYCHCLI